MIQHNHNVSEFISQIKNEHTDSIMEAKGRVVELHGCLEQRCTDGRLERRSYPSMGE